MWHWRSTCLGILAWLVFVEVPVVSAQAPPSAGRGVSIHSSGTRARKSVRSFHEIRQANVVRQRWDLSCGSAALSTLLTHHLNDPTPETAIIVWILRRTDPVRVQSRGGFSLLDLKRFAQARGYTAEGYADLSLKDLVDLGRPAIVPVRVKGYDHFVVFRGMVGDRAVVADSAFGNVTMKSDRFLEIWKNGIAFVLLPRGPRAPYSAMAPKKEEFLVPDGSAIYRAGRGNGVAPPTRRLP